MVSPPYSVPPSRRRTIDGSRYDLEVNNGEYRVSSRVVVNSAGLQSDRLAALPGIDIDREGYRLKLCKGSYFSASPPPRLRHLVYPVPTPKHEGLGVHATIDLGGRVRFGPDVEYVDIIDYRVDEGKRDAFHESILTYLPLLAKESLNPDMSGIRPKLQGPGEDIRDFVIREESRLGLPGWVNLIGIESPGLTACLAIAKQSCEPDHARDGLTRPSPLLPHRSEVTGFRWQVAGKDAYPLKAKCDHCRILF